MLSQIEIFLNLWWLNNILLHIFTQTWRDFFICSFIDRFSDLLCLTRVHYLSSGYVKGGVKVQPERQNRIGNRRWSCTVDILLLLWVFPFLCYALKAYHSLIQYQERSRSTVPPFLENHEMHNLPQLCWMPLKAEKSILKSRGSHLLHQGQLLLYVMLV